jgi:amino acid adenylation domain-containing protein/FkbM family methyltransferase
MSTNRAASHPTSYAQRRMWFLQMLDPSSPVYNIPCGLRYPGALEAAVLQRALDEIVRRHASLRTTFAVEDGEPVQVVAAERKQALEVVDLRPFPEVQRQVEVQRLAFKEAMTPFDLERGPLLRAMMLVVDETDPFLLFTMHHIVSDGWSVRLFFQELEALLSAYGDGARSPLEELPTQYPDYARWQRERLSGPVLESLLAYWRQRLADAPAVIDLPLDRPRPKVQRFVGATLPLMLGGQLHQDLQALSRKHEATLFMVLLAGFSALLHRYSGQTDIVVGTPVALREKPEFEPLIGLFVNTLALRVDHSGQPAVEDLLRHVVDVTVDAYSYQELPFERLVEELQPDRSLSHQPIVQAVFTLLSAMTQAGHAPAAVPEEGPRQPATPVPSTAKFDLTLSLAESEHGLWGAVEYNVDLFDAPTVLHFAERLRLVLSAMVADPTRPVADLPLLDDAERRRILIDCNPTARAWDSDATVIQRIWDQAEAHPDDIAVIVDRGGTATYRELVDRAEAVAAGLHSRGIGPGHLVPVCLHRSSDLMAALLGILRAGAAYVPLDPDHPKARLEAMVRDIGATVALVSSELADRLPPIERLSVADLEGANAGLPFPSLQDLAYAIFTSGSTGKPKCAANPHDAFLNRLLWMQAAFPLGAGDRVLQKTPYTFDVSVWELFWPLMFGSTVVFAVPGEHGDPAYLAEAITSHGITTLHFVPSMLRAFLEHPQSRRCTSLLRVIASGEALPPDVAGMFHSRLDAELHNLYGPTECAIDVTHWPCRRGAVAAVVPIGYPIWNVRMHVLHPETLEPVPFGAKGELFIAGIAVGRGYIGQPGLTAERFLPDPFSDLSSSGGGARMYRTGDLARYRADVSIEYLGRIDHQLKVRGFRIEAGEVERALCGHEAIAESVVTVRSTGGSDQRLVAHCVPGPQAGSVVRSLLRYEREGLLDDDLLVEEMENGLSVVAKNRGETVFLYDEIFAGESYLRHGIDLRPGSVVFDVGANIGMFALYAGLKCPGAKVYAFEPIPEIHKLLAMNAGLYPWDVHPRRIALGREPGTASFTYYPHVSILSGRYADHEQERDVILAFEANRGYQGPELERLVGDRLQAEIVECEVKTISQVLAEEGLAGIDLLKIDVEKSEHDVLAGISESDWPKIRQVAVEVHEIDSRVPQVCDLLHRQGFEVTVDQEAMLRGSGVSMVFGRRPDAAPEPDGTDTAWLPASPSYLRDQVNQFVAAQLPDYMVPSELIWIEEMPRLGSGKVDRKSLPAGSAWIHHAARSHRSVAPRTATEIRIAQIFSEVLGCGSVGLYERFFDLGGHSLLATSAIARMRDAFGVEVSLRDFFEDPTVAGLARCIESGEARSSDLAETIPRTVRGPEDLAPLSFTQQRLWFLDRFSPGDSSYNIPVILPLPFRADAALLERSLSEIARRHEILRTTFPFVDGAPAQRISADPAVRLRTMDVSSMDAAVIPNEVYGLVLREVRRPFDLANGPILRAFLIQSAPEQQILVLTMHHIAADGWSMPILLRELATIYDAFGKGLPSPLPELPVQFADFAAWQRKWLAGEVLERQHEYWLQTLQDAPKLLELPTDHARPPVQSTRGDIHLFKIEPAVYADLSALARQESCTVFMAFLAAFNVLFHRLCGVRDVSVGSPIANRRRPELEGLIGFFSNTIILRTKWEGDPGFRGLLRAVRDVTLGAFAHQDMPFEHLVSELEAERALDRTPLFQVMLIFQNLEGWDSTGLVEAPPVATGTSKFDLSLYLLPSGAGLTGQLEYCIDLFTRESVACMMDQFCELLAQAVMAPDAPVSSLPLRAPVPEERSGSPLAMFAGRRVACASDSALLHQAALHHGCDLILPERDPDVSVRTFSRTLRSAAAEVLIVKPRTLSVLAREFAKSLYGVEIVVEMEDPEEVRHLRSALPAQVFERCRWLLGIADAGHVLMTPAAGGDMLLGEPAEVLSNTGDSGDTGDSGEPAPLGAFGELALAGVRTGVRAIRTASGAVKLRAAGEVLRRNRADVEAALRRCAGVTEAVVAFDEPLAEPAAIVIQEPRTSAALIANELRAWLPPARIPRTIRFVTEIPLRSNGRVDLPALVRQARSGAAQYTAPRSELEHGIARLWSETLGVEKVSVHDDFFVLGGHSLLATAFIARLNLAFGVELPLRTLFEHPTIETLARVIAGLAQEESRAPVARLERSADDGPAPLSFAQQRLWFLDRYEPDSPLYNIVGSLPLRLRLSTGDLERAVNAIVQRHDSLRLRFGVVDWEPVQIVETDVHVPVPLSDLRGMDQKEAEIARLTEEIARESFDLERAPLLRLRLVQRGDDDYLLLMSIHHIIADGWSLGIFSRELSFFYAAFAAGETASLPELPIRFTDYARWQRSWFTGDVLNRHISYWRRLLSGAPPLLQLPEDFPRPPVQASAGRTCHATFGGDLLPALRDFSRAEGATTFMTLLAAYVALLSRYTGSADIVIGTPFANRHRPELAGMIGFIANTMALRFDVSGPVSFRELVGRVRSVVLESHEYQETPFEKIVEELQPDRDASFNPLFQLAFLHRSTEGGADSPAGSPRTGTAKFDFSMALLETPHEIQTEVEFKAALYTPETVGRFVTNYQRLLRGVLEDPERPVNDFDLPAAAERIPGPRLRVRGYDVDRDRVESVLRSVPGVREAAVTVHRDELVAFVQGSHTEAEARAQLSQQVPAFMIPSSIVRVTRLPRVADGGIDRANLPPRREDGTAPRTDLEQTIVTIFSDVLGWDGVGIHEDFLALGGQREEAALIAAGLSEATGLQVEPEDVFLGSNAEALAIALTQRSLAEEEDAERLLAELESLDNSEVEALLSESL